MQFKRPYYLTDGRMIKPTDLPKTMGREGRNALANKLDLSMGNLTLQPGRLEQHDQQETQVFAWEVPGQEKEEGDMFEGRFYVGSKVLTEVEMRSPVEESKMGVAKIVKASRKFPTAGRRSSSSGKTDNQEKSDDEKNSYGDQARSVCHANHGRILLANAQKSMNSSANQRKSTLDDNNIVAAVGKEPINKSSSRLSSKCQNKQLSLPSSPDTTENLLNPQDSAKSKELARKSSKLRRSLTDHDFAELRGCIDLGFVFSQDDIPDLCDTLPALQVCYAITQKLQADPQASTTVSLASPTCVHPGSPSPAGSSLMPSPISSWRIASPGDEPQQVKARLRHWAQAVACTVRQSC